MSRLVFPFLQLVAVLVVSTAVFGQTEGSPGLATPFVGEITGSDVYVRSGPSQNYYAVSKLSAGNRVNVVGEDHGWYAIEPPPGCYSLVSKTYVDVGADNKGTINGEKVLVRVGSDLTRQKYAVQTKLDKGTAVTILGEGADGFMKIAPPPGATLWVSADYVTRAGAAAPAAPAAPAPETPTEGSAPEDVSPPTDDVAPATEGTEAPAAGAKPVEPKETAGAKPVEPSKTTAKPVELPAPVVTEATKPPAVAPAPGPAQPAAPAAKDSKVDKHLPTVITATGKPTELLKQLQDLDQVMTAEMAKPIEQRDFRPLIEKYRPLAAQQTDDLAAKYAERRILQLESAIEMADAVRGMRDVGDKLTEVRKLALAGRYTNKQFIAPVEQGFDAQGELRRSMIYDSSIGPRRYRLVDPTAEVPRTLCYVELAPDSKIDPEDFLGRNVAVRAHEKYLQTGNVNPIMVLVAQDLVLAEAGQEVIEAPIMGIPSADLEKPSVVQAGDPRSANPIPIDNSPQPK